MNSTSKIAPNVQQYGALAAKHSPNDLESVDYFQNEESTKLDLSSGENIQEAHSKRWVTVGQVFFAAILVTIGCIATTSHFVPQDSPLRGASMNSFSSFSVSSLDLSNLHLRSANEYGTVGANYPWLDPSQGNILFEPYKLMTISVNGVPADTLKQLSYKWEFTNAAGNVIASLDSSDPSIQVRFENLEKKMLQLEVYDDNELQVYSRTFTVHTKYIKRELRSLTSSDREKFLDAAITLWKMNTNDGRAKYGSKYTSIDTFTLEHAIASNDIMCDQFHEGSGFLTHHMALQASFDAALKAVDPAVVLPYWDFTIEGQAIEDAGEAPDYFMQISPFLSDTWFGESDAAGHIINSRWAHTKFPVTDGEGRVQPNSYGIIRSYWNNNNDLEVTRNLFNVAGIVVQNKAIPTCQSHYDILNAANLGEFQLLSPAFGHGPMHVQTGGVVGGIVKDVADFKERWKDILFTEYSDDDLTAMGFGHGSVADLRSYNAIYPLEGLLDYKYVGEFFHIYRSLWRSHMCAADATPHLLVCPDSCDLDVSIENCKCTIPLLESGETTWQNVYSCIAFSTTQLEFFSKAFPEEMLKDLTYMTARTTVLEGEMVEAASPADILFWLIHPTINRLSHAKRLQNIDSMNGKSFDNWTPDEETWLDYSFYTFGKDENAAFPDGNTCTGHAAEDPVLPDALPLEPQMAFRLDTNRDGSISNIEFYAGTNPNDPEMIEYVFDTFNWDHCTSI